MKIKLIGCDSTKDEVLALAVGMIDLDCEFLDYSFHANPTRLHERLQELIDENQDANLIVLTYGRCSKAIVGLCSPHVPLLVPTTHDCIGLLLGSNQRHLQIFKEDPAVYFFSRGWLDYGRTPLEEYMNYVEKYGEEKARGIIQTLYGRYRTALFIVDPQMRAVDTYRERVREVASFFGWQVREIHSELSLLAALVSGTLVQGTILVKPGEQVTEKRLMENENNNDNEKKCCQDC